VEKEDKISEESTEETGQQEILEETGPESEGAEEDPAVALEKAREEAREAQDKLLRVAAEFENQKKRLQREKETALKYAEEHLIKEILPAIDNLERAMAQGGEDAAGHLVDGVELTLKGLISTLGKFGLTPMVSVGEPFDPNFHEAMVMECSKDVPEQRIIQEYEKGYMLKDRLLMAAKVVVSKGDTED
jgi:molecular chaperone GrpE